MQGYLGVELQRQATHWQVQTLPYVLFDMKMIVLNIVILLYPLIIYLLFKKKISGEEIIYYLAAVMIWGFYFYSLQDINTIWHSIFFFYSEASLIIFASVSIYYNLKKNNIMDNWDHIIVPIIRTTLLIFIMIYFVISLNKKYFNLPVKIIFFSIIIVNAVIFLNSEKNFVNIFLFAISIGGLVLGLKCMILTKRLS